jgi:hypothetical protein
MIVRASKATQSQANGAAAVGDRIVVALLVMTGQETLDDGIPL